MTGPDLYRIRTEVLGLSQAQMARMMGSTQAVVSQIEGGKRTAPTRYMSLLRAYMSGYRPHDWPKKTTKLKPGPTPKRRADVMKD